MIFKGSATAIITPFKDDYSINFKKLEELIEFQILNNTDAIVICGTTGESSTLNRDEKLTLIKRTVEIVNNRIPVIAGSGSNSTEYAIGMSKECEKLGVSALLIVTPYYNKCSQDGLFLHYEKIAKAVKIPIILYNVPSRTGVNISTDTVIKLSKLSNICGIKEASSNISQIAEISSLVQDDFAIYSGNDDQTLPILSLGGMGVISVISNILPNEMHALCNSYFSGDIVKAKNIQLKYLDLMKNLFIDVNPIPIKEAMNILGYNVGPTRLPLSKISDYNMEKLKASLNKYSNI